MYQADRLDMVNQAHPAHTQQSLVEPFNGALKTTFRHTSYLCRRFLIIDTQQPIVWSIAKPEERGLYDGGDSKPIQFEEA